MNKIKVVDDNLEKINVNKNISVDYFKSDFMYGITEIKINVSNNCDLDIEIELKKDTRLSFNINVEKNVNLNLSIFTKGKCGKIQYKYILAEKSLCNVVKFQNINTIKEMILVNLDGEKSNFNYNFKTICNSKETYDFNIFHNNKNTISNIKNNAVSILDGLVIFQVSAFVPKDITGCIVNQNNRIINLNNNKSEIKPNLYIDCNDVEASHSALIGTFTYEELFYMQSRGIDRISATNLLIRGFLTSDIQNKMMLSRINKNLDKYWR